MCLWRAQWPVIICVFEAPSPGPTDGKAVDSGQAGLQKTVSVCVCVCAVLRR